MTADEFKAWRKEMGYTQQQAATVLRISKAAVVNYEAGQRRDRGNEPVTIPGSIEWSCMFIRKLKVDLASFRQGLAMFENGTLRMQDIKQGGTIVDISEAHMDRLRANIAELEDVIAKMEAGSVP